ncbi:hypothetical protein ABZ832_28590 [Streptantibioticus parmotrematis]|uniref:hypothetical protein n=1 Tax=Streptantibioticus parmotrematis TaxID=2873249 RepID=UPI0033CFC2B4
MTRRPGPARAPRQAVTHLLLDWRDQRHFARPAPCVLCGTTTPLRSHTGDHA